MNKASNAAKLGALALPALLWAAAAAAQEEGYKGNPHVVVPAERPPVSVPFGKQHVTIPLPDSQITNLFTKGYQTFAGEVAFVRIASRRNPEKIHYAKIGDFVGHYRVDRVEESGNTYALYLEKSNETAVIRAHRTTETPLNEIRPRAP